MSVMKGRNALIKDNKAALSIFLDRRDRDNPFLFVGREALIPSTSAFSATLSSFASAGSLFRLAFSRSSSRNRPASDISMPPYFDFQNSSDHRSRVNRQVQRVRSLG